MRILECVKIIKGTDLDLDFSCSLEKYQRYLASFDPIRCVGRVDGVNGSLIRSCGPRMFVGEVARIHPSSGEESFLVEAVSLEGHKNNLMAYQNFSALEVGDRVVSLGNSLMAPIGENLLGRILDGMGRPIDGKGPLNPSGMVSIFQNSPSAMERQPIKQQIQTGIRAIDTMLPVGKGQRIGVFSGSGIGKSTLMGMIARHSHSDVRVITLIGERGREVREFVDNELGEEGLKNSVVIVSTSDSPPLARVRGAYIACTIAEYFRDQSQNVMLLFDSVTRFAMAQREIGLSNGEPPTTHGYTPSVFSELPKILERSGTSAKGSITGIYTVLVEGDMLEEPISDAVRGILDGHIILSRELSENGHFPAIDILKSVSRLAPKLQSEELGNKVAYLRMLLASYREISDLIKVGAYVKGTSSIIDEAIAKKPHLDSFFCQGIYDYFKLEQSLVELEKIYTESY